MGLSSSSLWKASSSQLEESDFCRCLLCFEQGDSLINVWVCFPCKIPDLAVPSLCVVVCTRPVQGNDVPHCCWKVSRNPGRFKVVKEVVLVFEFGCITLQTSPCHSHEGWWHKSQSNHGLIVLLQTQALNFPPHSLCEVEDTSLALCLRKTNGH